MKQPQPSASPTPHPIPDSAVEAFGAAYVAHGSQKGYADAIRAGQQHRWSARTQRSRSSWRPTPIWCDSWMLR